MLLQQLCRPETVSNALDVLLPPKGLPADVVGECVVWVDLFELPPNPACFLELTEMTKGRSEKSARKIRPGHEHNSHRRMNRPTQLRTNAHPCVIMRYNANLALAHQRKEV
jgi:hypothetical protein